MERIGTTRITRFEGLHRDPSANQILSGHPSGGGDVWRRLYWTAYLAWQMRGQARFPYRPLAAIEAARDRRVRRAVAHAYRTVPYYRETMDRLGLRPDAFQTFADLERLPVVERTDLQRDPERFVSRGQSLDDCVRESSGGTTGEVCFVYQSPDALFLNAAIGERHRSIFTRHLGRAFGYRQLVITRPFSSSHKIQGFLRRRALFPRGVRIQREYVSLFDPLEAILRQMNAFKPDVLHGHGSVVEALFPYIKQAGGSYHRPRVITYSADELSESVRRLIVEELGIPVFGTYQSIEALTMGFQCEARSGFHLNVDLYPVRIADGAGRTLPVGEVGDVVVSNLVNRATVLINYRMGDIATLGMGRCPCGRSLPLLQSLIGRRDEWFDLPDGRVIHTQELRSLFNGMVAVWRYQLVQEADRRVRAALVVDDRHDREATRRHVEAKLRTSLGHEVPLEVRVVPAIAPGPNGKHRPILSHRRRADR